jgi:hypothetical protein
VIGQEAHPAAAGEPWPAAFAVVFHNLGSAASCFDAAGDQAIRPSGAERLLDVDRLSLI